MAVISPRVSFNTPSPYMRALSFQRSRIGVLFKREQEKTHRTRVGFGGVHR